MILSKLYILLFLFSFSFLNSSAQKIISKSISYKESINIENKLNSTNITITDDDFNPEDIIIDPNGYPFGSMLGSPIEFLRSKSDFHIPPITIYTFNPNNKKLKYFEMKWNVTNDLDIFSRDYLVKMNKGLEEECKKKELYIVFYKKLIKKITIVYGPPTKRIKLKTWEAYNCKGWLYEWKTEDYVIKATLRVPNEGVVDFVFVEYTAAWR